MAFTTDNLQELHDYVETDPDEIGLKESNGDWKADQVIADLLNDPVNGGLIQRSQLSPEEIIEQIAIADWNGIAAAERAYVALLPSLGIISAVQDGTEVRANLLSIFVTGTKTRDNLVSIVQRQGSPAEVQWGEGSYITAGNVGHAANL